MPSTAKRVTVTGAAGHIGYAILPRIAAGAIFGPDTPVVLQCLEIPPVLPALEGVRMEVEDGAFDLLEGIVCTDDPRIAFRDADLCLLIGAKPRGKGMERNDLIRDNGPIFVAQGKAIEEVAAPGVRVVVVGNPCNTNCLIAMAHAPRVPPDHWTAMTRLDHNRALAQIALRAGADYRDVANVVIWGNHSGTQFPDWRHATVRGRAATEVIDDDRWFEEAFVPTVQQRGKAVIDARGLSSAMSAANAAIGHSRSLFGGTAEGRWTSMAVRSDGSYPIPEGLIASVPVRCAGDGGWTLVRDLELDDFARDKVAITVAELERERDTVRDLLG